MNFFLIDFIDSATQEEIDTYISNNSCSIIKSFNNFSKVYLISAEVAPPKNQLIEWVEEDKSEILVPLSEITFPGAAQSKNIDLHDEKNWWKASSIYDVDFSNSTFSCPIYGKNVTAYILDSGCDITHEEFNGVNISLFHSFNGTFNDLSGHGTGIASLISGNTCGLTNTKLKIVKILDEENPTKLSDLLTALDVIISDLPNNKISILNLSWVIDKNLYIENKLRQLYERNVIIICAAGNSGVPIANTTPASMPEAFTIGAYNQNFEPCNFSNYTDPSHASYTPLPVNSGALDGWAPGEKIYVARPGGGYGYVAGTSFSTAIHTGAVAHDIDLQMFKEDNTCITCWEENIHEMVNNASLARVNILSLTSQYQGSKNAITTYAGKKPANIDSGRLPSRMSFYTDIYKCMSFLSQLEVESVSITPSLPSGLNLVSPGYIEGTATLSNEDPDFIITNHTFIIRTRSGDLINHELELAVTKSTIDVSQVPEEYVWVTLQGVNCGSGGGASCYGRCPSGNPGTQSMTCFYSKFDPNCPSCQIGMGG